MSATLSILSKLLFAIAVVVGAMLAVATESKAHQADDAKVVPLLAKELANIPGKEGLMLTVEFPPGGSSPAHRHNAHVFVYVLEGAVEMQVEGGQLVTLGPGQTFYEAPGDIHSVARNASKTKKAKFLVFMIKDKGVAPVLPAK